MTDVRGKWALITGASRGIGRLTAEFLAKRGCNLVLHSRNLEHTDIILEELRTLYGIECYGVEAELSDFASVHRAADVIFEKNTPIDILVNNAGLQPAYRTEYLSTPAEDYTLAFGVNTIAPMLLCYRFLPLMKIRGFGRIVNTTSGIDGEPEQAGYSAAKAALNKVTRDLARTVDGTDVMLSLADPGWCRTDLGGPHAPNAPESALPGVVLGIFADDRVSGRLFAAQDYAGLTLEEALERL